jgi:hypothetical protein
VNPGGPVEEAGATARSLIDALKGQPAVLALGLVNCALLIFIFYAMREAASYRQRLLDQTFENGREIQQLLANCARMQRGSFDPLKPLGTVEEPQKKSEVEVAPLKPIE